MALIHPLLFSISKAITGRALESIAPSADGDRILACKIPSSLALKTDKRNFFPEYRSIYWISASAFRFLMKERCNY